MNKKQMIKSITRHMEKIGKERDELREIESAARELAETCQQAMDNLMYAIDSLSEMT